MKDRSPSHPPEKPVPSRRNFLRAAEFVTDSRSTFPAFDTTFANGFFVLDFIRFLESIESTFYAVNVPRFT